MYGSIAAADTYFSTRLGASAWTASNTPTKTAALTTSSKAIDRLNFVGTRTDSTQSLQFPRGGDLTVPTEIEEAVYENAIALIENPDFESSIGIITERFAAASVTYDTTQRQDHIVAGIASLRAWRILLSYLRDPNLVTISRV